MFWHLYLFFIGNQIRHIAIELLWLEKVFNNTRRTLDKCSQFIKGAGKIEKHDHQSFSKDNRQS